LLSSSYKIFRKILYGRLKTYCTNIVRDCQAGFCRAKSTIDHIFTIRQIVGKYWEYNRVSWHLLIDFKQAYDSIHGASMWHIMGSFNILVKLVRLVEMCYEGSSCCVRVGGELTDCFEVRDGLRQGCALLTLLLLDYYWRSCIRASGLRRKPTTPIGLSQRTSTPCVTVCDLLRMYSPQKRG
jgi:hypothetical protein